QENSSTAGRNKDFALARYDAQGRVDKSFGTNGQVLEDLGGGEDVLNALLVQPDDRIIVTGNINVAGTLDKLMQRFESDGSLDTTYSSVKASSAITAGFGQCNDFANAVADQSDGKVVAAGSADNDAYFALIRLEGERDIR